MTCKDCLHYEACIEMANDCGRRKIKETIASKCEYFTDRSEWVHLSKIRWLRRHITLGR